MNFWVSIIPALSGALLCVTNFMFVVFASPDLVWLLKELKVVITIKYDKL